MRSANAKQSFNAWFSCRKKNRCICLIEESKKKIDERKYKNRFGCTTKKKNIEHKNHHTRAFAISFYWNLMCSDFAKVQKHWRNPILITAVLNSTSYEISIISNKKSSSRTTEHLTHPENDLCAVGRKDWQNGDKRIECELERLKKTKKKREKERRNISKESERARERCEDAEASMMNKEIYTRDTLMWNHSLAERERDADTLTQVYKNVVGKNPMTKASEFNMKTDAIDENEAYKIRDMHVRICSMMQNSSNNNNRKRALKREYMFYPLHRIGSVCCAFVYLCRCKQYVWYAYKRRCVRAWSPAPNAST